MAASTVIKINFKGGIISPGILYNILSAAVKSFVSEVSFGLRQQLLIEVNNHDADTFIAELNRLQVKYQSNNDDSPNIVSSYPAEEIFISNNWLSEGVYKDIFDSFEYEPQLKINICDNNQSFTPLLTGNINWMASAHQHFWHLFVRFPKTNKICEWEMLTYTNDINRVSKEVEKIILGYPGNFNGNENAEGEALFSLLEKGLFILMPTEKKAVMAPFNLPYYEGLNRYNEKYWLGIYRRDELFSVSMLMDICRLSLETKIGQLCSTPWKSLIIKGIAEKDRHLWSALLGKHRINVRHALNELNFQVEDNCKAGLDLKQYLIRQLNEDDIRTFGLCIGIKTRTKSEVFSSILVRRRPLLRMGKWQFFFVYDILCAKDFNPNERTGEIYSKDNPKIVLGEQLRRAVFAFNEHQQKKQSAAASSAQKITPVNTPASVTILYQCKHCLTVYDAMLGEPENNIAPGTDFKNLSADYHCPLCEASKEDFIQTKFQRIKNDL
jgi:rubredoxin